MPALMLILKMPLVNVDTGDVLVNVDNDDIPLNGHLR